MRIRLPGAVMTLLITMQFNHSIIRIIDRNPSAMRAAGIVRWLIRGSDNRTLAGSGGGSRDIREDAPKLHNR